MRSDREYQICVAISKYLRYAYPQVFFHFDLSGNNLSKALAGKNKAIQKGKGFPDLFIATKRGIWGGAFFEVKKEGTRLFKQNGQPVSDHIKAQIDMTQLLTKEGYYARFCIGFDGLKAEVDNYLNIK